MAKLSIFLTAVALIAGIVGCVGGDGNNGGESYTLIVDFTAGGTVTVDDVHIPGKAILTYDAGTVVSVSAGASTGHRFVEWTGNASTIDDVNAALTTIKMDDDYFITANFIAQYVLTIDSTDGGHVTTPGEGTFTYDGGTVVDLVAEVEEGYKFLNWTGDVDTVANVTAASTTIMISNNYAIEANFLQTYIYLDEIGPGLWRLSVDGEGLEATVKEEGLVVNIASNPVDDPDLRPDPAFGVRGYSTYVLEGDFDIRVNYELTRWPQGSGVRVGLSVFASHVPDKFVNVERTGFGDPERPGEPREVYLVNFDHEVHGITGTDDLSGTLRICRKGEMVTGYYGISEGWCKIYEAEWSTVGVHIGVGPWSHEYLFGGKEVSVLMRTVEFIEPAP